MEGNFSNKRNASPTPPHYYMWLGFHTDIDRSGVMLLDIFPSLYHISQPLLQNLKLGRWPASLKTTNAQPPPPPLQPPSSPERPRCPATPLVAFPATASRGNGVSGPSDPAYRYLASEKIEHLLNSISTPMLCFSARLICRPPRKCFQTPARTDAHLQMKRSNGKRPKARGLHHYSTWKSLITGYRSGLSIFRIGESATTHRA